MFALSKVDFIEEVKAEMAGYEEIGQDNINLWVERCKQYLAKKKLKDKRVQVKGDQVTIKLDDESELFKIVDKYLAAIENEDLDAYWNNWSL